MAGGGYCLAVACRLLISVAFHAAEQAGLSCSMACGTFPDQGIKLVSPHWQAGSLPLSYQGSPKRGLYFLTKEGNVRFEKTFQPITCAYFMPGISCPCRRSVKIMNVKPSSGLLALPSCVFYLFIFQFLFIYFLVLPVSCYQSISLHPRAHTISHVIPWTSARQTPLSTDFSRQEYSSGLPFSSPHPVCFKLK